ncbi:hypothetical protein ONZ51_g6370 [Trametes cubensis]|uniref:Uncharacterized protein n=1 Tax=Trametes cubensis TaxID=1111947 RepID=A0AAD7TSH6_9APHY|nr:hypothetical protein ONZ51_g6370 [Trametes cubensis]
MTERLLSLLSSGSITSPPTRLAALPRTLSATPNLDAGDAAASIAAIATATVDVPVWTCAVAKRRDPIPVAGTDDKCGIVLDEGRLDRHRADTSDVGGVGDHYHRPHGGGSGLGGNGVSTHMKHSEEPELGGSDRPHDVLEQR